MTAVLETAYNGLASAQPSLPAAWYRDPAHHEREMDAIWRRSWLYAGRSNTVPAGTFRRIDQAGLSVILVRDGEGMLRGFLNVCRHRGARLCTAADGPLDRGRLTCPYHMWTYAADGRLLATGPSKAIEGFDRADFPLLPVSAAEHRGLIFVSTDPDAPPLADAVAEELAPLANWPLESLVTAHRYEKRLACNWKVFWENFNECLHCPNIHPALSDLVPIYSRAIMVQRDHPDWEAHAADTAPEWTGRLREGAETWSEDGHALPPLPGLTAAERSAGQTYGVVLPSVFIVGHTDYMRIVSLMPLGPQETQLVAEWLVMPEVAESGQDLSPIIRFAEQVLEEDGAACELNQQGLGTAGFDGGVLMREEYEVLAFQDWVRRQLREPPLIETPASRASRRTAR